MNIRLTSGREVQDTIAQELETFSSLASKKLTITRMPDGSFLPNFSSQNNIKFNQ